MDPDLLSNCISDQPQGFTATPIIKKGTSVQRRCAGEKIKQSPETADSRAGILPAEPMMP